MLDGILRILSRDNHGHPIGTIGRVSLPAQDPQPPSLTDVFVFVRVTNMPYESIILAREALERPVLVPGVDGLVAAHMHRFMLDYSQAESATMEELTTSREIVRNWLVIKPAIIDRATDLPATDEVLGLV